MTISGSGIFPLLSLLLSFCSNLRRLFSFFGAPKNIRRMTRIFLVSSSVKKSLYKNGSEQNKEFEWRKTNWINLNLCIIPNLLNRFSIGFSFFCAFTISFPLISWVLYVPRLDVLYFHLRWTRMADKQMCLFEWKIFWLEKLNDNDDDADEFNQHDIEFSIFFCSRWNCRIFFCAN